MVDKTFEQTMYDSLGRITRREASQADLALVYIMSEFIDLLGGSKAAQIHILALEAKWKKAQGEYARGET
jgi:predicted transcriptional regulator